MKLVFNDEQQKLIDDVFVKMQITEINDDNIDDVYYFIGENYEVSAIQNNDKQLEALAVSTMKLLEPHIDWG